MSERLAIELPEEVADAIAQRAAELVLQRLAKLRSNSKGRSEYLTVAEAAELLRSKPQRVYDLLSARRLRRYRDGSRVLIRRSELEAYLENGGQ